MRKKQAQHLDARYVTMVENAYYYCNPPPVEKMVKKKRPPLQEYIRKLLYKDLSKVTTEKVLRQMRKLPWQEPEAKGYLICCMVNIWNVKYNSIHCVANLLAGLVAYQEDVGIHVVDGVLEDIRLGMEVRTRSRVGPRGILLAGGGGGSVRKSRRSEVAFDALVVSGYSCRRRECRPATSWGRRHLVCPRIVLPS